MENEIYIKKVTVEFSDGSVEAHDKNVMVVSNNGHWDVQTSEEITEETLLDFAYDTVDALENAVIESENI